jgi:hypothetical protein
MLKNLNSEAKRSKLMLNCESSEAKRTCSTVEKIISKRSEHVYIEEFEYRSEANRFDSDYVFKKTKKSELSFFLKTKGKKRKDSLVNYRSFAIPIPETHIMYLTHCCWFLKIPEDCCCLGGGGCYWDIVHILYPCRWWQGSSTGTYYRDIIYVTPKLSLAALGTI